MRELKINDKLIYKEFENDILMFDELNNLLNNGFSLKKSIFIAPLVTNGKIDYLLSTFKLDFNKDIIKQINDLYEEKEILYPDFNDTILNDISGIRNNFGYSYKYNFDKNIFNKKYKNCIVMLLDGLGENVLNYHLKDSFLKSHHLYSRHAIYPSTTAASTTSTITGLTPLETSWTGWSNYIKEMGKEVILFTGEDYYTGESTGVSGFKLMPTKPFFSDMNINSYQAMPDFSKPDLKEILKNSLKNLKKDKENVEYVYYTEPDGLMHEFGTYSQKVNLELKKIDELIKDYVSKLPEDTLLIISADHGHIPVKRINLFKCEAIMKCLKTKPSNDSRCMVFRVKDNMKEEFEDTFNKLFSNVYKLVKSSDAIKNGYFGNSLGFIHERINDFLGDYVAFATNEYYFNVIENKLDFIFKSHHAGITKDEMLVPVIVIRK